MVSELQKERFLELEKLARAAGLDPYDVHFFEVPASVIYDVASYGLPTRYSHWSFGAQHQHQRIQGEMGFSKIYELILANSPSYAFLDKSNTDTVNLLICAHCLGHSHIFKNNYLFQQYSESNMIAVAKRHAEAIDKFRNDYGDDEVDEWLDIALALERHIDVHMGLNRQRYPTRHVEYTDRPIKPYEDVVSRQVKPYVEKIIKGIYLPPEPERDILWFLSEYANLEPWQQRILQIVRRESYYFWPQHNTKILNEGCASYWHAELMHQYSLGSDNDYGVDIKHPLTAEEHLDFLAAHEKVVQPGLKLHLKVDVPEVDRHGKPTGKMVKAWNPILSQRPGLFSRATRLNPYYVGFRILRDIKERWDKYYKDGFMEDEWDNKIPVTVNGDQKLFEVFAEEDDVSLLRKYLTEDLAEELHLFTYGNIDEYDDCYDTQEEILKRLKKGEENLGQMPIDEQYIANKTIAVRTKEINKLLQVFARNHSNYGVPLIYVRRVDESGLLRLEHCDDDQVNVDIKYAEHVLKYIHKVWGRPVEMIRKDKKKNRTWVLSFDGFSFEVGHEKSDYPECIEEDALPSSW